MRKLITKGEVAELLEIKKSQIRFYEKKKLLNPSIDHNGYAMYDFDDLDQLEMVLLLKELDTPIKVIKKIVDEEENYDYESFLSNSHEQLQKKIEHLQNKQLLLEQKMKIYSKDQINSYSIKEYDDRHVYMLKKSEVINTPKEVYELLKTYHIRYLDHHNELCTITHRNIHSFGFINIEGKKLDDQRMPRLLEAGSYFSYFLSYQYEDDYESYMQAFHIEAKKKGLTLDDEIIFINHFSRKFYEKHRVVGSIQARVLACKNVKKS